MRTGIGASVIVGLLASPSILSQEFIVLDQLTPADGGQIQTPDNFIVSLGGIGDFNGDTIADFAIGGRIGCAEISIFYGSAGLLSTPLSVENLDGSNGRRIQVTPNFATPQECADGPFGNSISAIGDFDQDGFDDFSSGVNYLFLGNANTDPLSDPFLCGVPGNPGVPCAEHFEISSWREGTLAGDFNQDGALDLFVSDPGFDGLTGRATVVFGPPNSTDDWTSGFALDDIDGMNGLHLNGDADEELGKRIAAVGDINNDNFDDVIVTIPDLFGEPGKAAVLLGTNGGFSSLNASALNGTVSGFTILGATDDEGISDVTGKGDMNGDGISDLAVARFRDNQFNGVVDVIFGRQNGFSANVDITTLTGADGFSITGGDVFLLGLDLSFVGDINGDGLADLALGSSTGLAQEPAGAYVIFGSSSGFPTTLDITTLNGSNGFLVQSARANSRYDIVAGAGDVNNDGIDDLLLGEDNNAGDRAWLMLGNATPRATATQVTLSAAVIGGPQPGGRSVSELFAGLYDDADPLAGAAIRGATATGGVWQTQTSGGQWQDLPAVSDASAVILQPADLLRFLPGPNAAPGDSGTLSVRLWDGRWRSAGSAVDISNAIGALGGFANDENLVTVLGSIVGQDIFSDSFEN